MNKPKIVILGAGYGGIMTTVKLQKMISVNDANITLVNKHDYHYQTTWLHENAAGNLHHDNTRVPIKDVVNFSKVNFVQDTVESIKPDDNKVLLKNGGEIDYDYLVVGLGFEAATFGIPGLIENAFTIDSINTARLIREHIEYNFAMYNNDPEKKQERLNIVVGGGGFTGIEFVGELANRVPELCKEYDIERSKVRIINVEAAPTVLPGFDPQLVEYAMNSLESRGVEFKLGTFLKECHPDKIVVEKDEKREEIPTLTTVWAAGVRANSIVEESGFENNRGKVEVKPDLRAPDYSNVFVVGDCALIMNKETERPYPPTAQIAMQMADIAAHNLKALISGSEETEEFVPEIKGTVASLGDDDAIGVVFGKKLFGWQATVMKKVIDNRWLLKLGGIGLLLKKGKFNIFH
ncbi:NAD(P)/FAD-dependent oxidoreductase [Aquibacillus sp. 3ASR75-11]|uniref:NAD(P)/FAD-dependent oxidoreductase n=1 Tax=Terrihalobacillus insolitus TaxID=2950438 RepID=A0A9X4AK57_9BACI|nr:NAD(P)/FAD-dependent oxidoreductase [Terrihalobacillus insolitus]MDC3412375.1 NAD(P)/FAD-dependent oxidoreductase [Terrihalobacillus insolitus]MDC3422932.1 NAD(P)/FAD-dependent oxidoreductase [Terrihalobacillus insolitus]